MTINDIWLLITAGLVSVVSFIISIRASERCSTLEQDVDYLRHCSLKLTDISDQLANLMQSINEDIKKVKDERQVDTANISKILAETNLKIDNYNSSIEKRMEELYDIVQRDNKKHVSAVEWWADKEELADIVDPENNDANSDKVPVYRWIFPAEEPDHEKRLINGQRYTIIGALKNQIFPTIDTYEGFWNGHEFLTDINDNKFDTVYAYIKKPESADVMEKVVQMALANKG